MDFKRACDKLIELAEKHPLRLAAKKVVIHRGSEQPQILFIGEAPGFEEDKQGIPFIGKSGKILDKWIADNKIESYAVINTVPLIPLQDGRIRAPTEEEVNYFQEATLDLLKSLNPKFVICVGRTSTKIFRSTHFKLSSWSGNIGFIYHPSYYMRNGRDGSDDFKKLLTAIPSI